MLKGDFCRLHPWLVQCNTRFMHVWEGMWLHMYRSWSPLREVVVGFLASEDQWWREMKLVNEWSVNIKCWNIRKITMSSEKKWTRITWRGMVHSPGCGQQYWSLLSPSNWEGNWGKRAWWGMKKVTLINLECSEHPVIYSVSICSPFSSC